MRTQEIRQFPACARSCLHLIAAAVTSSPAGGGEAYLFRVRYTLPPPYGRPMAPGSIDIASCSSPLSNASHRTLLSRNTLLVRHPTNYRMPSASRISGSDVSSLCSTRQPSGFSRPVSELLLFRSIIWSSADVIYSALASSFF